MSTGQIAALAAFMVTATLLVILWVTVRQRRAIQRIEQKLSQEGSINLLAEWLRTLDPVSYTHLTLPTNREV